MTNHFAKSPIKSRGLAAGFGAGAKPGGFDPLPLSKSADLPGGWLKPDPEFNASPADAATDGLGVGLTVGKAGLSWVSGEIAGEIPPLDAAFVFIWKPKVLGCFMKPADVSEGLPFDLLMSSLPNGLDPDCGGVAMKPPIPDPVVDCC